MKKSFLTLALGLLLSFQLNVCTAEEYQEELTLPVGAHFDLEMDDDITGMDYDAKIITIEKINGREIPVLKQTGDTIVTVYFKQDKESVPMRFLLHSLPTARYDEVTDEHGEVKPEFQQQYDKKAYAERMKKSTETTPVKNNAPKATDNKTVKLAQPAKATEPKNNPPVNQPKAPAKTTPATTTPVTTTPVTTTPVKADNTPKTVVMQEVYPEKGTISQQILYLTNLERVKNKLQPLKPADELQRFSNTRAEEIAKYFSHVRPDGSNWNSILPDDKKVSAENIGSGRINAKEMFASWMRVPAYRANILNPVFKEMSAGHTFKDNTAHKHYWVQIFRG